LLEEGDTVEHLVKAVSGRSPLRVMIAERHRTVAQSLTALVGSLGAAEVTGVAHGSDEAIAMGSRLSPDVAIVDLDLSPNCSLVSGLHSLSPNTRIIVLGSRSGQAEDLVKALAAGAVGAIYREDSLDSFHRALERSTRTSPVVADEAAGMLLSSYMDVIGEKRKKDVATIEALAAAVEARDMTTGKHLERVGALATKCMQTIDPELAAMEEVAYGFTLHDVGKIGIPDHILKKPGPLTEDEWTVMRGHPEMGVRIVEPVGFSDKTTQIILCHHERWDGSGYPNKLRGDEIPLEARVFSVADAYDAMTSDRPYRAAMDRVITLDTIKGSAGTMFDPDVVDVFVGMMN
jgi:ribonuclease P protein subunit RPR2